MLRIIDFQDVYTKMYPDLIVTIKQEEGKPSLLTKNITIVVTEQCNLRCSYCYQHNKNNTFMTKETVEETIEWIFREDGSDHLNEKNAHAVILDFIGGEPLLEVELIDFFMVKFLSKAVELNHRWKTQYMISMTTNGILYNSPQVKKFLSKYQGRVSLTITIDGNKDLHDSCRKFPDGSPSYDIVEKSIREHLKHNPLTSTKLTLAPANIQHLSEAIIHLYTVVGLKMVNANCVYEEGWEVEHARVMYHEMNKLSDWILDNDMEEKIGCSLYDETIGSAMSEEDNQNWCGGTGLMLSVTADGNIQPCLRYTHFNLNDKQPELRVGNIRTGLHSTQEHVDTYNMLEAIDRRTQSTDECYDCPIASGCSWCSAYNYEMFGTPNKRATFICPMHKARVLANVYFWNKYYKKQGEDKVFKNNLPEEWIKELTEVE